MIGSVRVISIPIMGCALIMAHIRRMLPPFIISIALFCIVFSGALFSAPVVSAQPVVEPSISSLKTAFDSLPGGSEAELLLLTENRRAWVSRWWMMENAQSRIDTTYFIVEKDIFGMSFLGHLLVKGMEGVKVRFMLDMKGSLKLSTSFMGKDYLQELVDRAQAEVKIYSPAGRSLRGHLKQTVKRIFGKGEPSTAIAACNHDKILIADDDLCLTGGRNLSYHYFAPVEDSSDVYRDTDVMIRSRQISDDLRKGFSDEFEAKSSKRVKGESFGLNIRRDIELTAAYIMMDYWLKADPFTEEEIQNLNTDKEARDQMADLLLDVVEDRLHFSGIGREANFWDIKKFMVWGKELIRYPRLRGAGHCNPETEGMNAGSVKILDKGSSINKIRDGVQGALVSLVNNCSKSIVIQNPYVVLTSLAVDVLAKAGARGVKITIITNSPVSTDSELTQGFFLDKWPQYLAAIPNLEFKVIAGTRKLHAKTAVFDDCVSFVGTYNLDYMSARVNSEIISVTWSEEFAAEVLNSIVNDSSYRDDLFEYRIKRDDRGRPVDRDPLTPQIEPVVEQGAKDHIPPELWKKYKKNRLKAVAMETLLPQLDPLF